MKLSVGLISIFLTSALTLSVKRQNEVPSCVDGDPQGVGGPYKGDAECAQDCYLMERSGERVGQICKGYCDGTPLVTGTVVYNCYGKKPGLNDPFEWLNQVTLKILSYYGSPRSHVYGNEVLLWAPIATLSQMLSRCLIPACYFLHREPKADHTAIAPLPLMADKLETSEPNDCVEPAAPVPRPLIGSTALLVFEAPPTINFELG